ncbi:MAG: hypothetical protein ACI8TP_002856 [Acidimicrobiales bacterium]|jgi:hypothetical protein
MHPASTLLFLLGYSLVLPVVFKRAALNPKRLKLALAGHQLGLALAALGWVIKGRVWIAVAHLAWAVVAKVWYQSQLKHAAANGPRGKKASGNKQRTKPNSTQKPNRKR